RKRQVCPFQCTPAPPTPAPGLKEPRLRMGNAVWSRVLRKLSVSRTGAWNRPPRTAYFNSSCIWVVAKSGTVARSMPRSSASTCTPSSVSSCAMIDAVQPNPTRTTSTGFSLLAILPPLRAHARTVASQQAHRGHGVGVAVARDFVDIVVAGPRKADQLPACEVAIAAVHRVGEKTFLCVLPKNREKCLGRKVLQFDLVFIQVVQDLVLVLGRQLGVGLAVMALATVGVHTRDRLAIP